MPLFPRGAQQGWGLLGDRDATYEDSWCYLISLCTDGTRRTRKLCQGSRRKAKRGQGRDRYAEMEGILEFNNKGETKG